MGLLRFCEVQPPGGNFAKNKNKNSAFFLQITMSSGAFTVATFKLYAKVWKINAVSNKGYPFKHSVEADPDIDGTTEEQTLVLLWSDAAYG